MTASPSRSTRGGKDLLLARYLRMPLSRQLYWVWFIGLSWTVLMSSGGWLTYQFLIKERLNVTAEIAVTSILRGIHQYLDLDLQNRDHHLQEAAQLAEQKTPASAKFANTTILWAGGQTDPRGSVLSPAQRQLATAALAEHQRQDTGQMLFSEPLQNPQTGDWAIQLSRRISAEGIVLSYWTSAEIEAFISETFFLPEGKSLLVRQDGRILIEASAAGVSYGRSVDMAALLKQQAGKSSRGSYMGTLTGIDDAPRLYLWRKLDHYPLYVLKGTTLASIANLARPGGLIILSLVVLINGFILFATLWAQLYMRQVNVTINDRRAAEQTMRLNEDRLNFALVGSGSAEWEVQLPEQGLYVSRRLAELLGSPWAVGTLASAQWQALIHPDDLPIIMTALQRLINHTNQGREAVVRVCDSSPDGYRWLAITGRIRARDAADEATLVSGLATDVNEQQITQAIVRDRTAQLDAIFTLSPDAFVSFDHHLKVKYVNPAFGQITGWRDDGMRGMSEAQFSRQLSQLCVAKTPFDGLAAMRAATLDSGHSARQVIELNSVPQRILRLNLLLSDAPTVSQILYLRDVTHETIVESMKSEFLATAAHELRTPMASIVGFAELLCTHPLQQAEQLEFTQIIWRQSLHLAGILDELLDLSRIEVRGGKGLVMAPLDLSAKVCDVVKAFPLPQGRDAPAANLPQLMCKADPDKTRQVLNNVISNAYKFSGPGTSITITPAEPTVHPVSGRPLLGLVIRDAGIGMSPEQLRQVFDRFYRADKSGVIPGNGLGLSISRELMALMGGQIIIASVPQQGTTVSLMFERLDEPPLLPRFEPNPLPTTTPVA